LGKNNLFLQYCNYIFFEKKHALLPKFENAYKIKWGAFYLSIANFFVTYNIGGAKELVALLCLSGEI